ncbi:hypothetical protein ACFQ9J_13715 [Streptomyces sp. NPDC056529]|uniref:hypothetical protein n=1 Tax=Streptomyces sp. NPDC056529 TaxID=3345855 RepID=UPI0036C94FC5
MTGVQVLRGAALASWPYTVRLPRGRRDHRARRRPDGFFETACPAPGGTFLPGAGHLTRALAYRACPACTRALTAAAGASR